MQFSTVSVNFSQLREETLDGRTYLVAPVVAIVAGVLNGLLVTQEEIAAVQFGWNGIPLVIRHPTNGAGQYISANSPTVLQWSCVGRLFNTRMDGDKLKGEAWLDVAKMEQMGGEALELLQRVRNGNPVEVSTGYLAATEPRAGRFNGQDYHGITRSIVPDHLALLPDADGACNWQDGCGLPRANQAQVERPCACGKHTAVAVNQFHDSVMVAFFLPDELARELARPDLPGGLPAEELHLTLAYMGKVGDEGLTSRTAVEAAVREFVLEHPPLHFRLTGNIGRFPTVEGDNTSAVWLEIDTDAFSGDVLLKFRERLASHLETAGFPVSREHDPYTPHITLAYIPVDEETPVSKADERWIDLSCLTLAWGDDRITSELMPGDEHTFIPNEEVRMDASTRVDLVEQPTLPDAEEPTPAVETDETTVVTANEDTAVDDATDTAVESAEVSEAIEEEAEDGEPEATPGFPSLAAIREQVGQLLEEALAPFMPALTAMQANHQRQVDGVRQRILSNARNTFTAEELADFDLQKLEKLAGMLDIPSPNYAGRGQQVANDRRNEEEDGPLPMPKTI